MKTRLLFVPLLLALVASLAACGGTTQIPSNAIAVVGDVPIPTAEFNTYFKQALEIYKQQYQTEVKPGTTQYEQMRDQTVAYLVQIHELEQQAPKEHPPVSVTQAEVTKYLTDLAKQSPYDGSMEKLTKALKNEGLTMEDARQQVYVNLLADKVHSQVTASVQVTTKQARSYYELNHSQYTTPAQVTREVAHILVKTRARADMIEQKLADGADFADLARQYSTDRGSAIDGGKLCVSKTGTVGKCTQTLPPFAKAAFALNDGEVSAPVQTDFGWHVIKALGPVQRKPAHTQSFKDAEASIKQTLSQGQVDQLWAQWLSDLKSAYAGKVRYQTSYTPPATSDLSTITTG
ncbi:MAG: foldase protein PrsA [Gaiellaceae bacterium]|jgi:foldase protein PrsA|nr:foldase protein PrsA [Gaiellaceae bacterium]